MHIIDTTYSRSYSSEGNLIKAIAPLCESLDKMLNDPMAPRCPAPRVMRFRNAEGRWTAAFILAPKTHWMAAIIAGKGFLAIG